MLMIRCQAITEGMRSDEKTITLLDANGKKEFLRLEPDYLVEKDGETWLPVAVLREDNSKGVYLIEFPHESEGGTNRIWVRASDTMSIHPNGSRVPA